MELKSEFLQIAKAVLEKHKQPMSAREIVRIAIDQQIMSDKRAGKTPSQTMKSKLSVHIRRHGVNSPFVRTRPGKFHLRSLLGQGQPIYDAPPLHPPAPKERVLVFPSIRLDDEPTRFQGTRRDWKRYRRRVVNAHGRTYMDRIPAEQNDDYKQIITYVLITRAGSVLSYRRGTYNRVEDFLRGCRCVGFGGHVTEADHTLFNSTDLGILDSAAREVNEELELPPTDRTRIFEGSALRLIGVLNDDSSPAGRRHFAFVCAYEVSEDPAWEKPLRREKAITQLRWLRPGEGSISFWDFEYWSQLVLRQFYPEIVKAQPSYRIIRHRPLQPPHLLCVTGGIGSGKSEATRVFKEHYGYVEINSGRVLAKLLGLAPVPETPRNEFQRESWRFISSPGGPAALASALYSEVANIDSPRVLIDGIRQLTTMRELKTRLLSGGRRMGVLYVHAPPDIAFKLYCMREGVKPDVGVFQRLREAPVEGDVLQMIRMADGVLYNWLGKLSYRRTINQLVADIEGGDKHGRRI